jgi:hypothetical protein
MPASVPTSDEFNQLAVRVAEDYEALQTTVADLTERVAALEAGAEPRDPLRWPYPTDSFWNMPVGADARLVPLNMPVIANPQYKFRWEEEILTLDPGAPIQTIQEHNAGWSATKTRCGSRTGRKLTGNGTVANVDVPIPPGFHTEPYLGTTPNHSSAHVRSTASGDIELFECQPTHICSDGVCVSQFVNSNWVGDSIITGGYGGARGGAHGGSYMTAFGGTIRCHEWVPDGRIPHAVKIVLNTSRVCYNHATQSQCFTWPASRADSGAVSSYGSAAAANIPPEARMGMLCTLPAGFDPDSLRTEPARIFARAIYEYGAYLVDGDAGLDVFMVAVEWSNEGRVLTQFEEQWGFKGFHRSSDGTPPQGQVDYWADMDDVYSRFVIVADNALGTPGGAGSVRRAPFAPPIGT